MPSPPWSQPVEPERWRRRFRLRMTARTSYWMSDRGFNDTVLKRRTPLKSLHRLRQRRAVFIHVGPKIHSDKFQTCLTLLGMTWDCGLCSGDGLFLQPEPHTIHLNALSEVRRRLGFRRRGVHIRRVAGRTLRGNEKRQEAIAVGDQPLIIAYKKPRAGGDGRFRHVERPSDKPLMPGQAAVGRNLAPITRQQDIAIFGVVAKVIIGHCYVSVLANRNGRDEGLNVWRLVHLDWLGPIEPSVRGARKRDAIALPIAEAGILPNRV